MGEHPSLSKLILVADVFAKRDDVVGFPARCANAPGTPGRERRIARADEWRSDERTPFSLSLSKLILVADVFAKRDDIVGFPARCANAQD